MVVHRLYVGNLSLRSREDDVWDLFRNYKILEVAHKGNYAFVEFRSRSQMYEALDRLNDSRIVDQRIRLEVARAEPLRTRRVVPASGPSSYNSRSRYVVYVRNISRRASWLELKNLVRRYIEPIHVDCNDRHPGEGEIYVASRSDSDLLIRKLDGVMFQGYPIRLSTEMSSPIKRRKRSRTPSRGRGRSYSRSYSRQSSDSYVSQRSVKRYTSESQSPERERSLSQKSEKNIDINGEKNHSENEDVNQMQETDGNPYSNFFGSTTTKSSSNGKIKKRSAGKDSTFEGNIHPSKLSKVDLLNRIDSSLLKTTIETCLFLDRLLTNVLH